MAACRPLSESQPGIRLVRPLFRERRADIMDFLERRNEPYRTDATNRDTRHARNRVRHELIPWLEEAFHTFSVESLCRLNDSGLEVSEMAGAALEETWERLCIEESAGRVVLCADGMAGLPRLVRDAATRRALGLLAGPAAVAALGFDRRRLAAALPERRPGCSVALPGGVVVRREHGLVVFVGDGIRAGIAERPLPVPGAVDVPEAGLRLTATLAEGEPMSPGEAARVATAMRVYVDAPRLDLPLTVRSRRAGDRFHPLGGPGGRRLKEFMVDAGIPRHRRDTVPLVVSASGDIAWVVGHRIGDKARLSGPCERPLCLEARPLDDGEEASSASG